MLILFVDLVLNSFGAFGSTCLSLVVLDHWSVVVPFRCSEMVYGVLGNMLSGHCLPAVVPSDLLALLFLIFGNRSLLILGHHSSVVAVGCFPDGGQVPDNTHCVLVADHR